VQVLATAGRAASRGERPRLTRWAAGAEAGEAAEREGGGASEAEAMEAVLSGKVAELVFRSAVAALPRSVAVRRRFLTSLQPFSFPGVASVAEARPCRTSIGLGVASQRMLRGAPKDWHLTQMRCWTPAEPNQTSVPAGFYARGALWLLHFSGRRMQLRLRCSTAWVLPQTRGAPPKQGRGPAQAIYASLEQDFPDDEDAWDLRARRHLGPHAPPASAGAVPSGGHGAAVGAYEAAVAALPTPRMYDAYAAYLAECLDALAPAESAAEGGPPGRLREPARAAARALVRVYERAAAAGAASEAALLAWPRLLLRCGKAAAALAAAEAASGAAPRSAALWRQRLLLHAQHAAAQARSAGPPLTRCHVQVTRMHSVHAAQHSRLVARGGWCAGHGRGAGERAAGRAHAQRCARGAGRGRRRALGPGLPHAAGPGPAAAGPRARAGGRPRRAAQGAAAGAPQSIRSMLPPDRHAGHPDCRAVSVCE